MFDRLKVLNMFRGFEVPADDPTLARFHVWSRALFERPCIQGTMHFLKDPALFIKVCLTQCIHRSWLCNLSLI